MGKKLVFYTSTNSPGKRDSSGAFEPEAKAFTRYHDDAHMFGIPCRGKTRAQRAQAVYDVLNQFESIESVVFMCHGFSTHCQFGFGIRGKDTVYDLSKVLSSKTVQKLILYCCSVASSNQRIGPHSFCGEMHKNMRMMGVNCTVIGHSNSGHTTWNPYVKVFANGDYSGKYIVEPGKTEEWAAWRKKLRKHPTYRFQFPYDAELDLS